MKTKTDPIQDYILKSERNLRTAFAIARTWPLAREQIVAGFLDRLDSRLKKKLKGWKSEKWDGTFFVHPYPGFSVSKPAWKHYSIGFQCGEYGKKLVIGIARDTPNTRKLPLYPPLLKEVQQIFPTAQSKVWWEARFFMHSPASDWRDPEVLWRMHTEAAFMTDVADQLLEMVDVSERTIDRLSRRR